MDFVDNNIQKAQVWPKDQVYARNEDIKVYGKLVSMSTENVVADSEQIWDKNLKKNQSDINSVTQSKFGQYLPLAGGRIDGDLSVIGRVQLGGPLEIGLGINARTITVDDGNNSASFTPTSIELGLGDSNDETHVTAKTINTNKVFLTQKEAQGTVTVDTSITPNLIQLHQTPGRVTTIQPTGIISPMFQLVGGTDNQVLLGDGTTTSNVISYITTNPQPDAYIVNVLNIDGANNSFTILGATKRFAGLMTAVDKTKLDDVPNIYAEKSKTISNITVGNRPNKRGLYIAIDYADRTNPGTMVNIPNATTTSDGCMSYEDKNRLDNIKNTYLPLSGGTVTGGITVNGAINTKSNITTDGTVTAKGFVSKTEKNRHEVWACNGGSLNLKTIIAATAAYVHGSIVESIAESINKTVTIEDPDAIVFNKATGSFLAKKGNGYYRYWITVDNLLISDSDKYGTVTSRRGTIPYHKQLYIFDNDNANIYIADNTGSVPTLDIYIN